MGKRYEKQQTTEHTDRTFYTMTVQEIICWILLLDTGFRDDFNDLRCGCCDAR